MLDTIKKYVKSKDLLATAKSLLETFKPTQEGTSLKPFSLDSIKISNFGKIREFQESFGKSTIVTGPRGIGKSWYMESGLWALTGKCRTTGDVTGVNGDEAVVPLNFSISGEQYTIIRKCSDGRPIGRR